MNGNPPADVLAYQVRSGNLFRLDVRWQLQRLGLLERPDQVRAEQVGANIMVVADRSGGRLHLADCGPAASGQSWSVAGLLVRMINGVPGMMDAAELGQAQPAGEEIRARERAVPQERACPTCGGPVITKVQADAEWADYTEWVDRGTGSRPSPDGTAD